MKRDYAEAEAQKEELKKEMLTVELQGLSTLMVIEEFASFLSVSESDLDPNLWVPFSSWKEKIKNLPFVEISPFREQMISAIREAGKNERDRSVNSVKAEAIQQVEKLLKEKGIKLEDLEPNNRNYKEEINRISNPDLDKEVRAIIKVEERVSEDIKLKARGSYNRSGKKYEETDHWKNFINQTENSPLPSNGGGWGSENNSKEQSRIQAIIDYLKNKQAKGKGSQSDEKKLKELEEKLKRLKSPQSSQPFFSPYLIIIGGIVLVVVIGIGFLIYRKKINKKLR